MEGKVPNNNHVHVDSHLTLMDSDAEADSTLGSQNDTATPHSRCYVFYVLRTGSECQTVVPRKVRSTVWCSLLVVDQSCSLLNLLIVSVSLFPLPSIVV